METHNQDIYKIRNMLQEVFRNIELKDIKIREGCYMRNAEFIFDIKRINSDFHIGIDINRVTSIDEMFYIIKSYLIEEILRTYELR